MCWELDATPKIWVSDLRHSMESKAFLHRIPLPWHAESSPAQSRRATDQVLRPPGTWLQISLMIILSISSESQKANEHDRLS